MFMSHHVLDAPSIREPTFGGNNDHVKASAMFNHPKGQ
jgi:hypothetical protein